MMRQRSLIWIIFSLAAAPGCELGAPSAPPSERCAAIGERCLLRPGQLGVCTADAEGRIACMSQH